MLPVDSDVHTVERVIARLGRIADISMANDGEHATSEKLGSFNNC